MDKRAIRILQRAMTKLVPPRMVPPWQWAEQNRIMPQGGPEPGPYRVKRTPWVKEVTERAVDPYHTTIILVCSSQVAKTDGVHVNLIGHRLDLDPAPVIYFGPTQTSVKKISKQRITPLIANCASLDRAHSKGHADSIYEKVVNGQPLILSWMGSRSESRSQSSPLVLIDERDAIPQIGPEGDIVEVARARGFAYEGATMVVTSSPLKGRVASAVNPETGLEHWQLSQDDEEVQSPIWRLWQGGSRSEWAWPCPHCEVYFVPRAKHMRWEQGTRDADLAAETAHMLCPSCNQAIQYIDVRQMNDYGRFVIPGQRADVHGIHGEERRRRTWSAWLSGLCSNWATWESRVHDYVKAQAQEVKEPGTLQGTVNTAFGELYAPKINEADIEIVLSSRQDYLSGTLPEHTIMLTAAIDVHAQRLNWVVRAWLASYVSYLVAYGEIWEDCMREETWDDVQDMIIDNPWGGMLVDRVAVDAGYRPEVAYWFASRNRGIVFPVMGQDNLKKPWMTTPREAMFNGQMVRARLGVFDPNMAKRFVHSHMGVKDQPGAWYLPSDVSTDYCEQIVAEHETTKPNGKSVFEKDSNNNHFLDCEGMAYIMAYTSRLRPRRRAAQTESQGTEQPPQQPVAPPVQQPQSPFAQPAQQQVQRVQPGSSWGSRW